METYEATFEIASKSDARAVERLMNKVYDSLREESRSVHEGTMDSTAMLAEFEAIRDATRRWAPGRLTVVFERQDEDVYK